MSATTHDGLTSDENERHNGQWLDRAALLVKAHLNDALGKHRFFGRVSFEFFVKDGKITGAETNTRQTLKDAGEADSELASRTTTN